MIEFLLSLHPKNRGKKYIQGWYCWPHFMGRWNWPGYVRGEGEAVESRINPLFIFRTWLCDIFVGHEISKTEWGSDGGELIDCHCRWCDKLIQIPRDEARFRFDTFNNWGRHLFIEDK